MPRRLAPRPIGANSSKPDEAELSSETTAKQPRSQRGAAYQERHAESWSGSSPNGDGEAKGLTKAQITRRKALYNVVGHDLYGWEPVGDPDGDQLCGFPVERGRGTACRNRAGGGTLHPGVGYCWNHQIMAAREQGIMLADVYRGQNVDPEDALERQLAQSQSAITILTSLISEMPLAALESTPEGRVAMRLLQQERDRLTKTAKSMIDMDFRERQTGLAEKLSQPIVAVLEGVLADLRLDRSQQAAVGPIVRKHLALLEGGRLPAPEEPITVDAEIVDEPAEEDEDASASG